MAGYHLGYHSHVVGRLTPYRVQRGVGLPLVTFDNPTYRRLGIWEFGCYLAYELTTEEDPPVKVWNAVAAAISPSRENMSSGGGLDMPRRPEDKQVPGPQRYCRFGCRRANSPKRGWLLRAWKIIRSSLRSNHTHAQHWREHADRLIIND
jgi:hypothetical protein